MYHVNQLLRGQLGFSNRGACFLLCTTIILVLYDNQGKEH